MGIPTPLRAAKRQPVLKASHVFATLFALSIYARPRFRYRWEDNFCHARARTFARRFLEASKRSRGGGPLACLVRSENLMVQRSVSEAGIALGTQQLAFLLDSTRELIAILGPDGTLQFANATFQSVLGYPPDELQGRSLHAIVNALDD